MNLGRASVRRNGLNALVGAIHPRHGLVWTDGQSIYLSPVTLVNDVLENEEPSKLGEFDYVQSVHWSCDLGDFCYLCVVHQTTVSLWKVHGSTPDLQFKQVRKINATPIPQGVLWSPVRDILCILSKDKCSFYYRHTQNKGSYALPPIESGKITAGCWSDDGEKLVIGIGSIVLIYQWHEIDKSIQDYTIIAWKIPNVEGRISSLAAVSPNRMICTAELPLEKVCQNADADLFDTSDLSSHGSEEENNLNKVSPSLTPQTSRLKSHIEKLLNLTTNSQCSVFETSQLVVFEIQGRSLEPSKVTSANMGGFLVPDLLYYDVESEHVVVGCNMMTSLHVFRLAHDTLTPVHEVVLHSTERPKGICGLPSHCRPLSDGFLLLVGQQADADPAFLPCSTRGTYELDLQFHALLPPVSNSKRKDNNNTDSYSANLFKELHLPGNNNSRVHLLRINKLQTDSRPSDSHENYDCNVPLVLPGENAGHKNASKGKIVLLDGCESEGHDLSTEKVDFRDHMPHFTTSLDLEGEKKDNMSGCVNLADSFPHVKHKLGLKSLLGQRSNVSSSQDSLSDVITGHCNGHGTPGHPSNSHGATRHPSVCHGDSRHLSDSYGAMRQPCDAETPQPASEEMVSQMASLEGQVRSQGGQITELQERVDQIARLLEDTSCVAEHQYQPATEPEIVQLTWRSEDRLKVVTKSFVLDKGRLQFEPVKQAFGLLTVELFVDGIPCVVGSNVDGYIPVRFSPRSCMEITGKRAPPVPEPRANNTRAA